MSSPIILGRASEFRAEFYDSWEGLQLGEVETAEAASILILADFSWDKLQLSMHRSTTKSMFSIVQKIQEFIAQQQKRSERTISLMLPAGSAASRALAQYRKEKKEAEEKRVALKGAVLYRCQNMPPIPIPVLLKDPHHVRKLGAISTFDLAFNDIHKLMNIIDSTGTLARCFSKTVQIIMAIS